MYHISHVLFLVLKSCQNLNPGDARLRDISLAARHSSHQSITLDTVFNFQTIGWYSFQGLHSIGFSFSRFEPSVLSINITETLSRKPE